MKRTKKIKIIIKMTIQMKHYKNNDQDFDDEILLISSWNLIFIFFNFIIIIYMRISYYIFFFSLVYILTFIEQLNLPLLFVFTYIYF